MSLSYTTYPPAIALSALLGHDGSNTSPELTSHTSILLPSPGIDKTKVVLESWPLIDSYVAQTTDMQ